MTAILDGSEQMADPEDLELPVEPIDKLVKPIERFLHIEAASGVFLVICTATALILANSAASDWFLGLWKTRFVVGLGSFQMDHSLGHWINDGLMTVFFFVIGLEVKRELAVGELRDLRNAVLPIAAAFGGMLLPAGLYLALQWNGAEPSGWGIPMATDIAFVVGCMALLGPRVPHGLRVMLLSLAIVDDIGAILVIAIGYTASIDLVALGLGLCGIGSIFGLQRLGVRNYSVYIVAGIGVWVAFHESGVHATISGVIIGLLTPSSTYAGEGLLRGLFSRALGVLEGEGWADASHRFERMRRAQRVVRESISPLEYHEGILHPWVGFVIMPVFAMANAGVVIALSDFLDPVALAIGAGLVLGKPLGVTLFSFLAVRAGLATLPQGVTWPIVVGGGCLAGIGFTMALFIAGLAMDGPSLGAAKVGILGASLVAAALGMALLVRSLPTRPAAR